MKTSRWALSSVLLLYFSVGFYSGAAGLNFFTAEVNPPDTPYTQVLSGNDVFEVVYNTFNNTGLVAIGGALLLATGKIFLCLKIVVEK